MIHIQKADLSDVNIIAAIGKKTFLETYLINTPKEAVESFVATAFELDRLTTELQHDNILFYLVYFNNIVVGYAKIELNMPNEHIKETSITKLDRLYVLREFHGKDIGVKLFQHLIKCTKEEKQAGIWLYVWIENARAIRFYKKNNFKKVGTYDFVLSETRSNPNDVLFLAF